MDPGRGTDRGVDPVAPPRGPDGPPPGWRGGPPPPGMDWRNIDQARADHQSFNYKGIWVTPQWRDYTQNWGFWFFGLWIPL